MEVWTERWHVKLVSVAGVTVRVVAGSTDHQLGLEPRILRSESVVIGVLGHRSRTILLDGRKTRISAGVEGLVAVDLTRSTGYHRVEVDGSVFWFGSEDAKVGLAGVEAMLAHLRTVGTGWTGQALFSDGAGLRDSHVVYAWLDEWAERALTAVDAILRSPRPTSRTVHALSRRGGSSVLAVPTLRLLRSAPKRYLSSSQNGLIKVGSLGYDPLRVVVKRRSTTLNTVANRRAVGVLRWLVRLAREVLDNQPGNPAEIRCRQWLARAESLQRRPIAQALAAHAQISTAPRQAEEATEGRYRAAYQVAKDLLRLFGWSASTIPQPRFSYVQRADTIYQAYVASCLAKALGLRQTSEVLGEKSPAFADARFDLYYDTPPPKEVLRSWRFVSHRPDESRPDLLLHERASGRVALLDAKFRVAPDGGATEGSRKEVVAYLGLYGLNGISIAYPGMGRGVEVVAGNGRRLVEIAASPPADLAPALREVLTTLELPSF